MKSFSGVRLMAGCLLGASLFLAAPSVFAQESGVPSTIAVVDVDRVYQDSSAMKSVRSQMERFQQTFRDEVAREENALRNKQQDLQKQAKSLTQDQMVEKGRQFDQDVAEFRRKAELRSRALDKSYGTAMGQVNEAMLDVARQVAGTHGANIVLSRSQLMFFDEKMNITAEVSDGLNKKLPNVTVPAPKLEAEAAPAASKKK